MISMVFRTRRSPSSSPRGRRVRALENSVQTGEAQIKSKCPGRSGSPTPECRRRCWAESSRPRQDSLPPSQGPRRHGPPTWCR